MLIVGGHIRDYYVATEHAYIRNRVTKSMNALASLLFGGGG